MHLSPKYFSFENFRIFALSDNFEKKEIITNLDKKIILRLEYLHLGDANYSKNNIYGKMFFYSWDKKERKFYSKKVYKTRIQDYTIYKVYDGKGVYTAIIDRETGILTFSGNTF